MDEMKIGDFSQPLVDPAKAKVTPVMSPPAPGEPPSEENLSSTELRLTQEERETEAALKPKVDYEEMLKEAGIPLEEAAQIVDAVLFKGHYSEKIKLSSRVSVVLRTRQARDTSRAFTYLEVSKPLYEQHFNEIVSKYALAASLESLGTDTFVFPPQTASADEYEAAFQKRLNYVNNLPDPVLRLLFVKSYKFDEKVRVVLQEGAIENF